MNEIYVLTSIDYEDLGYSLEDALTQGCVFWDLDSAKRAAERSMQEAADEAEVEVTPDWSVWKPTEPQTDLDDGELRMLGSTGWTCEEVGTAFLIRGYAR